jgi:hypothetical protein
VTCRRRRIRLIAIDEVSLGVASPLEPTRLPSGSPKPLGRDERSTSLFRAITSGLAEHGQSVRVAVIHGDHSGLPHFWTSVKAVGRVQHSPGCEALRAGGRVHLPEKLVRRPPTVLLSQTCEAPVAVILVVWSHDPHCIARDRAPDRVNVSTGVCGKKVLEPALWHQDDSTRVLLVSPGWE